VPYYYTSETKPTRVAAAKISISTNNGNNVVVKIKNNNNGTQADFLEAGIHTTTIATTTKHSDEQKNVTTKEFPKIMCSNAPLRTPTYEWHYYSNNTDTTTITNATAATAATTTLKTRRLLLAQYSAYGNYARLLELTAPMNKEYARRWNHDLVILQGTTMLVPTDQNCTPQEERSRFNKVTLLQMALTKRDIYDQLLILDADAMMYDLEYDVTRLLLLMTTTKTTIVAATTQQNTSSFPMLVAQRVHDYDPSNTWNINNGVMLWNLHHPLTESTTKAWEQACRKGLPDNRPFRGDQFYLHQILQERNSCQTLSTIQNVFLE
jgi:hypothetical protein